MIYENINGVCHKNSFVFEKENGIRHELKYKMELKNGIYRKVYKKEPLYLIKNKVVMWPYENTDHVAYETYYDPMGYGHQKCNICEYTSNGFHFGFTFHNSQNAIYIKRRIKSNDYKKITITISQINYASYRDFDSRIMLVAVKDMMQQYRVYKDFFNVDSASPPKYYMVGTYTVDMPILDFDYIIALKPYSTVSTSHRSSRFDCTISELFLHN